MTPTESRMRAAAMALPVSDFGSHRAIQAAAAVADAMVAERETQMLLAMDSLPDAAEVKRLREINAEMLAALKALLRCPDIDDIDPEDRDPETEDAIRVARALITNIALSEAKQAEGGQQ